MSSDETLGERVDAEVSSLREDIVEVRDALEEFTIEVRDFMTDMREQAVQEGLPDRSSISFSLPELRFLWDAVDAHLGAGTTCGLQDVIRDEINRLADVGSPQGVACRRPLGKRPMEELNPNQLEGRKSAIKGARNEEAVYRALDSHVNRPDWLYSARLSSEEEDGRGIDVVAITDVGEVYVQVKSSYENAERWLKKWPMRNVGMVVIRPRDSADTIYNKAVDAVGKQRAAYLKALPFPHRGQGIWDGNEATV